MEKKVSVHWAWLLGSVASSNTTVPIPVRSRMRALEGPVKNGQVRLKRRPGAADERRA
jgi:hypothetical protein